VSALAAKLFAVLFRPGSLLVLGLVLGLALSLSRWRRLGRTLIGVSTAGLLLLTLLPIGGWLLLPLENRFPPPQRLPEAVSGVIVLGGSTSPGLTLKRGQPVLNNNSERLLTFAALARRYPQSRLVFTGGGKSLRPDQLREADVARQVLTSLGLDASVVEFERESSSTFENALNLAKSLNPQAGDVWLLITSARHMPRAVGSFRQAGFEVMPYPVDYRTAGGYGFSFRLRLRSNLGTMAFALHEWIGLLTYRLQKRTSSLFPGP
jgi:uncharacterized SAM-binding protein YcdF (DUF218 family)